MSRSLVHPKSLQVSYLFTVSAMPLLEHNLSMNSHMFARAAVRPIPEILDWDEELPLYTQALRGQLDAIM